MDFVAFTNEILDEIIQEEKAKEKRRNAVRKAGCKHTNKVKRSSLVYKTDWLECAICGKQFYLNGKPVE